MEQTFGQLNNLGVSFLQQGNLQMAFEALRGALDQASAAMVSSEEITAGTVSHQLTPNKYHYPHRVQTLTHVGIADGRRSLHYEASASTAAVFIYAHGVEIDDTSDAYSPDSFTNASVICATILFNLALVYHLKGVEGKLHGKCKDARIKRAYSLYSKCATVRMDCGSALSSKGKATIDILSMALLNNLAQIGYELCQHEMCRAHLDQLVDVARNVDTDSYQDYQNATVVQDHISFFLLNSMTLNPPTVAAAA